MDVHTKSQRSYNMSRIRSKNTKPEVLMFTLLKKKGFVFETHYPIAGKPDIVFPDNKLAVFIDGEFWHGKDFITTKNKLSPFWLKKISENIKRDNRNTRILRKEGWHVLHLWGRKITKSPDSSFKRIVRFLDRLETDGSVK